MWKNVDSNTGGLIKIVLGWAAGGSLIVESFNHFTDGSGRFDYYADEVFRR